MIKNNLNVEEDKLQVFEQKIQTMLSAKQWNKEEIVELLNYMMPNFGHKETGLYLDGKMQWIFKNLINLFVIFIIQINLFLCMSHVL